MGEQYAPRHQKKQPQFESGILQYDVLGFGLLRRVVVKYPHRFLSGGKKTGQQVEGADNLFESTEYH